MSSADDEFVDAFINNKMEVEELLDLSMIRVKIKDGNLDDLELEQLIAAIISEDSITADEVLEEVGKVDDLPHEGRKKFYSDKYNKIRKSVGDVGVAKAGRVLSVLEIVRRYCSRD
jgi:hypothetical protein